ncbi:hypothetical protein SETIT_9G217500v2 [Setaria italica]|uniref:Uncharacterized protein n=2 Tax=Setaria TaxID=4554 RepID=A0A368SJ31_SETIT|nr:hypothetical protein SETIT_9G217500v2 [Setaria italica]TKV93291.1 hypothetical protein SEVIR_9G216500v2 [Setaria viridis]
MNDLHCDVETRLLKSRQNGTAFDLTLNLLENTTCRAYTGYINDGS